MIDLRGLLPNTRKLALAVVALGLVAVGVVVVVKLLAGKPPPRKAPAAVIAPSAAEPVRPPKRRLKVAELTPEQRRKGYHECNPADPLGLGPYAPLRPLSMGRIAIPQRGGHTKDYGYDVLVHFHGADPMRKTLVQVAYGVAFAGIDRGMGSGPYTKSFERKEVFPRLLRSIERAFREHSGSPKAHIRHLALSAWSAGYGSVNQILRYHAEQVDAVVLLDSLHARWKPGARRDGTVNCVDGLVLRPTFEFAKQALLGRKIFILTHSYVDPVDYPSVALTAKLLRHELGVAPRRVNIPDGYLVQEKAVDERGLHIWSYRGHDELTHCAHLPLIARAVRDVLEEQWDTPEMDRSVPNTPAPKLGSRQPRCEAEDDEECDDSELADLGAAGAPALTSVGQGGAPPVGSAAPEEAGETELDEPEDPEESEAEDGAEAAEVEAEDGVEGADDLEGAQAAEEETPPA